MMNAFAISYMHDVYAETIWIIHIFIFHKFRGKNQAIMIVFAIKKGGSRWALNFK